MTNLTMSEHNSVFSPPISKPITGCPVCALYVVSAYPTTPPAGPDSTARDPLNLQSAFSKIYTDNNSIFDAIN